MEKEGRYSNRIEELLPNYPVHAIYVVDGGWTGATGSRPWLLTMRNRRHSSLLYAEQMNECLDGLLETGASVLLSLHLSLHRLNFMSRDYLTSKTVVRLVQNRVL